MNLELEQRLAEAMIPHYELDPQWCKWDEADLENDYDSEDSIMEQ